MPLKIAYRKEDEGDFLRLDYYPFACPAFGGGSQQPGRQFNAGEYRYAFNGKEYDEEWNGTGAMYDYGFRIYDSRIAKFLSVDPLTRGYPMLTPYQFASNSPISGIDLDGLEAVIPEMTNETTILKVTNNNDIVNISFIYTEPGAYNTSFITDIYTATWISNYWGPYSLVFRYGYFRLRTVRRFSENVDNRGGRPLEQTVTGQFARMVALKINPELASEENSIELDREMRQQSATGYAKPFRHFVWQGLLQLAYPDENLAKDVGDFGEQGSRGEFNNTNNSGRVSFGDLMNNSLARQYASEYEGDVSDLEGFVNFLNYMSEKVTSSFEETQDMNITFTTETPGVQQLFEDYQNMIGNEQQ